MSRIIWWDLETTGLNPFHNKIIEISARDNSGETFNSLIKMDEPLDVAIVKITGITDSLLSTEGHDACEVFNNFYNYMTLGKANTRTFMVAHNGDGFDRLFLKTQLNMYGLKIPGNIYFLDSLYLSRLVLPHMKSHSLETLCKYYKIDNKNAHRAESDVNVLCSLWNIWTKEFSKMYGSDKIRDIYNKIYF